MVWRLLLPTVLVAALPAIAVQKDGKGRAMGDQERIQGTWECISTFKDGKKVEMYVGVRAVMKGKSLTWIFPQPDGSTKTLKATFRLDADQDPKHFDWSPQGKPDEVHKRLYSLKGDTLRWSTNLGAGPRPESFKAGQWQFVMKRIKEKE